MQWSLGYSDHKDIKPRQYLKTCVPMDVQIAMKENGMEDYNYGGNFQTYKWMEDKWWFFKTNIDVKEKEGFVPVLLFAGLNYRYTISINDREVLEDEGMFTPVRLCLSQYQNTSIEVTILLHPIPKKQGTNEGKDQASGSCIPAVAYGWDWHPRLVPIGIYDEVKLVYVPFTSVQDVDLNYALSEDLSHLKVNLSAVVSNPQGNLLLELTDGAGQVIVKKSTLAKEITYIDFEVQDPKLWWCVDQGQQNFYTIKLSVEKPDETYQTYSKRIGFRRVKLVMNQDAWEGASFPKTQGKPPITIELNGRRIFAKGTNFVPPEIFPSLLGKDTYEDLLVLAKDCHMNLLRMWGGGLVNKECFFDLCDELGLMVWQEFPLACNNYEDDPKYLAVLDKESKSIISRLKKHPSVVMWCGGNELMCSWGGMTNQSLALRLLDKNCYDLDQLTPYIMSSPQYGMGHGHYMPMSSDVSECISDIIDSDFTAYTEFGVPSPSPFDYIKSFTPPEELYRVEPGTAWEYHHAVNAWDKQLNTWFCMDQIRKYFGQEDCLETIINNGMILQKEIYKHIYEESRRKWPKTSMALNWCYNEPWPTAANNSIVNYPSIPKLGYYGVQAALRNQMLSARVYKMIWKTGETISIDVFALNDLPEVMPPTAYRIEVIDQSGTVLQRIDGQRSPTVPANSVSYGATYKFTVPDSITKQFTLKVICEHEEMSSEYLLFVPQDNRTV